MGVWRASTIYGKRNGTRFSGQPGQQRLVGQTQVFYALCDSEVKPRVPKCMLPLKNLLQSSNIRTLDGGFRYGMGIQHQDGSVLEVEKTRLKPPPLYKVILLNDDYTPMDFVVVVLQTVFAMSREKATQVMLQVHREGMGVCGTYTAGSRRGEG